MVGMESDTNIRSIREARGLTLRDVAQQLDTTPATISRWEREPQRVTVPVLKNLARVLDVDPAELLHDIRHPHRPKTNDNGVVMVKRLEVLNNTGEDNPFDAGYISRLTRTPASELAILTVASDAMAPLIQLGDQALIDMTIRQPDIPGIYALKIGDMAHLRRVHILVGSGRIRVGVDNPAYGEPEDLQPSDAHICGRVIWVGRKM